MYLFAGLRGYSGPLLAVFVAGIVFCSSFIGFSSVPLTTASLSDSDSTDSSTVPLLLWNYTTSSRAHSTIIDQGILYFTPADDRVYALNAARGTTLWTAGYSRAYPVVDDGTLFVNDNRRMYALDGRSGERIWENHVSPGGGDHFMAKPVIANDILYVCLESGLRALDATTGDMLWQYVGPMYVVTSPLVVDDVVYVGSYNTVYAFDAQRNHKIWSYTVGYKPWDPDSFVSSFVVDDEIIYFCAGNGNAYALNAGSGYEIWRYTYTSTMPKWRIPRAPFLSDGLIYVVSDTGDVCALNASDGTKLWSSVIGKDRLSVPFLSDGLIYVVSDTGDVCALNASDGTKLWSSVIGEGALSVPAFYEGVLYFGSDDGNLYALNATSGLELWNYQISSPISLDPSSWRIGGVGLPVVCDGVLFVVGGEGVFALAVSSSFVLPSLPFYLPSSLVLLIVEVVAVVVVVVCCVWLYLFKKRNRLKTSL